MSIACTFSGKYVDILWSLPTAREISRAYNEPVHFYTMEDFGDICELIAAQPYIASAQPLEGWKMDNWGCGAQPWQHPPLPLSDALVYDLTYQDWPKGTLVDFIAKQASVTLPIPLGPFLVAPSDVQPFDIAMGFSHHYDDVKQHFARSLIWQVEHQLGRAVRVVDVVQMPWRAAAEWIAQAKVFIGERSSNHVMAHGLGKPVVEYEIDTTRHNRLFSFPYSDAPCYCPSEPETFELFKHLATCIMNNNRIDHPTMRRYAEFVASLLE